MRAIVRKEKERRKVRPSRWRWGMRESDGEVERGMKEEDERPLNGTRKTRAGPTKPGPKTRRVEWWALGLQCLLSVLGGISGLAGLLPPLTLGKDQRSDMGRRTGTRAPRGPSWPWS